MNEGSASGIFLKNSIFVSPFKNKLLMRLLIYIHVGKDLHLSRDLHIIVDDTLVHGRDERRDM